MNQQVSEIMDMFRPENQFTPGSIALHLADQLDVGQDILDQLQQRDSMQQPLTNSAENTLFGSHRVVSEVDESRDEEAVPENNRYWLMPGLEPNGTGTSDHIAQLQDCLDRMDYSAVRRLIQDFPYLAQSQCCRLIVEGVAINVYPLHYIVADKKPHIEAMDDCITAFPSGLLQPDALGRLPLHLATRHGAPHNVVAALVSAQPKALTVADIEENLPLHHAVVYQSCKTVQMLIARGADACQKVNNRRRTPLHVACGSRADDAELLMALMDAFPGALLMRDRNDKLPLHVLCGSQPRQSLQVQWVTLQRMVSLAPSACLARDQDGYNPLKILQKHVPVYDILYVSLLEATTKETDKSRKGFVRRLEQYLGAKFHKFDKES